MAENVLDLNINIGANITDLDGAMQKAQNLLSQFQNALKKATNVGEINYLNKQIEGLNTTIANINTQMGSAASKTGDATQSLINFSRIAQDAPYGIQGVANNLNPMLESFQRLAATEGGTKKALLAMVEGLSGPAGIGVALGVVSSLAVAFSGKISKMFETPTEKLKEFKEELGKLNEDIYKILGSAQANKAVAKGYEDIIGSDKYSLEQRQTALKYLKDIYKDSKEIQELTINSNKQNLDYAIERASKQEEYIGKEKNNVDSLSAIYKKINQLEGEKAKALAGVKQEYGANGVALYNLDEVKKRVGDSYDAQIAEVRKKLPEAQKAGQEIQNALVGFTPYDKSKDKKQKDYTLDDQIAKLEHEIDLTNKWADAEMRLYKQRNDFFKQEGNILKADTGASKFNKYLNDQDLKRKEKESTPTLDNLKLPKDLPNWFNNYTEAVNKNDEALKKQAQDYSKFASMIARDVTGALKSAWDAIQKGESPLEAIGNAFIKIGEDIAFAVLEATIFKALLEAFPELKGVFATVGAISGALSFGAHAEGGITTGPSLGLIGEAGPEAILPLSKLGSMMNSTFNAGAMSGGGGGGNGQFVLKGNDLVLALQRSNYSLNLRRGA